MSVHFHPLRITAVERDAEALLLSFATDGLAPDVAETFRYQPGQYLTLRADIAGEDVRRNYSICGSSADSNALRVAIRLLPGGRFSSWAALQLAPGDTLQVLPPEGRFVLQTDPARQRHVVFFAAGSGITPVIAVLRSLLRGEPRSHATLVYGNRMLASTMFRDELADLKNRHLDRLAIHHVFSREAQEAELFNGRIDQPRVEAMLQALVPAAGIDDAYVCGPAGMIEASCAGLAAAGIDADRIHVERFGDGLGPAGGQIHHDAPEDADHAVVSLLIDGLERRIDCRRSDPSILDAGLRNGLELPYACKAGVCSTCRGRVLSGRVRMERNFALTPDELAQGFVLCCQSHPLTDRVAISLDQR
ncbi:2Fe-2S iron-sulfur cluster-binding protein [Piscinibacter sakaiensis]|uniref:2Fe-2S iron-sulfur cluster-binding protein n=1 Tax=Piscinibacter sakaiensis TaxID=1547922 RepID=UPI003AAC79C1